MPKGSSSKKPEVVVEITHNPYEDLFLEALKDAVPNLSLYSNQMLAKKIGQDRVADLSLELFGFIKTGCAVELTKVAQLSLAAKVLRCLISYMKDAMKMPVTTKTILDCIPLLDEAVDRSFPGYVDAKILQYVVLPLVS